MVRRVYPVPRIGGDPSIQVYYATSPNRRKALLGQSQERHSVYFDHYCCCSPLL